MAKKIISFGNALSGNAKSKVTFEQIEIGENKTLGIRGLFVLFSTNHNRNKAYFQVTDLLKLAGKETKLLTNFNHNLDETGGQYLGNLSKWSNIQGYWTGDAFEIVGEFISTDPVVMSRKDEITAPSIEILVDEEDTIRDNKGREYYTKFEPYGVALLTGQMAGSGDARLLDIQEFNIKHKPLNNMDEKTLKNNLEAFKADLLCEFDQKLKQYRVNGDEQVEPKPEPKPEPAPEEEKELERLQKEVASFKAFMEKMKANSGEEIQEAGDGQDKDKEAQSNRQKLFNLI